MLTTGLMEAAHIIDAAEGPQTVDLNSYSPGPGPLAHESCREMTVTSFGRNLIFGPRARPRARTLLNVLVLERHDE